jgi:hypothetical protein
MDSGYVVEGTTMAEGIIQDGMIRRHDIIWQYAECCTGPHGDGEK